MSKKSKAVIWDMDGVIADTVLFHLQAWQDVFRDKNVEYSEPAFRKNFGKRNDTIVRELMGEDATIEEVKAVAEEKEVYFRKSAAGNLKALPGVKKLIDALYYAGFFQALGSSAPRENVSFILGEIGLSDCFKIMISGHDVTEGKPNPQGFLLAAEKLGIDPKNCLVIEDAIAGVAAAKNAGMKCLAVTNTNPADSLKAADRVVDSLEEITPADILEILNLP